MRLKNALWTDEDRKRLCSFNGWPDSSGTHDTKEIMASSLHQMARSGNVREAGDFFRQTTDSRGKKAANALDSMQRTPLHLACWAGKVDMIRILLANRADCMAGAQDGYTPLHFCAQSGCADGCRLLLDAGAKVNAKLHKNKRTPLHLAAAKGHVEATRILVRAGADTVLQNSKGETPIDLASIESVKSILLGENVDSQPTSLDEEKSSKPAETRRCNNDDNDDEGDDGRGVWGVPIKLGRGAILVEEAAGGHQPTIQPGLEGHVGEPSITQSTDTKVVQQRYRLDGDDSKPGTRRPQGNGAGDNADNRKAIASAAEPVLDRGQDMVNVGEGGVSSEKSGVDNEGLGGAREGQDEKRPGGSIVSGSSVRSGSLAERRRKKRRLAQSNAAAGGQGAQTGVSLSHLEEDEV